MYINIKQVVSTAVSALSTAVNATSEFTEESIMSAKSDVDALSDYMDFFGVVGEPSDLNVQTLSDNVHVLKQALEDHGYYNPAIDIHNAKTLYDDAKASYDGFTGGMGGTGGGAGSNGAWEEALPWKTYPWFECFNATLTKLWFPVSSDPPPEEAIDFTVLLGPCSDVFIYGSDNPDGYWEAGLYQYARLRIWVRFVDMDVIFEGDYGETPLHPTYSLSYDYVINDNTDTQYFRCSFADTDWQGVYVNSPVPTWPYDSSNRILTKDEEALRGIEWNIVGTHTQEGHDYWLYNLAYWEVWHQTGIPDGLGGFYGCGRPEQLVFVKDCGTPPPGKDILPKPIPIPIPILTDDKIRTNLAKMLRLSVDLRPYELMFDGQKLLFEGEQLTFGDI